jgi:glycine/D-amino acid oxidase-like deaminating enzyme
MSKPQMIKVAVIGGGVTGASAARSLALVGVDVILLTDHGLTNGASGRSLSWLNSSGMRSEPYHRLRMASIDRYRTLSAQQPAATWLRFDGALVCHGEDGAELLRQYEYEVARGYDSHLLTGDELSGRTPGLNPRAMPEAGVIWHPGEAWVDLPSLVEYLIKDLEAHGGRVVTDVGRCRVLTSAGSATGVETESGGHYDADEVLLATGAAVPAMVAELGVTIPDATPVVLQVTTAPVQHELRAVVNTPLASLRPTPNGALAVDSDWTNAHIATAEDGSHHVPDDVVVALLAEASLLLSGAPKLTAARVGIGPKPIPGDGEPVLGAVDEIDRLWVAFTHSGATLAMINGELLAYEIVTGKPHPMLADFNARRFH